VPLYVLPLIRRSGDCVIARFNLDPGLNPCQTKPAWVERLDSLPEPNRAVTAEEIEAMVTAHAVTLGTFTLPPRFRGEVSWLRRELGLGVFCPQKANRFLRSSESEAREGRSRLLEGCSAIVDAMLGSGPD
jgi:hypothetical protein